MLLEENSSKRTQLGMTDIKHEGGKKARQCFNTLLVEQLLLGSSARNGCAKSWTYQQMVTSTVWHASYCHSIR